VFPYAVRKGVDFRTAVKYETLLRNCGCLCKIQTEPYEVTATAIAPATPSAPVAPGRSKPAWPDLRRHVPQIDWADLRYRLAGAGDAVRLPRMSWTLGAAIAPLLVAALYVAWPSSAPGPEGAAADLLSTAGAPAPAMAVAAATSNAAGSGAVLNTMTRSEFEAAVKGRNEAQIIAAVGPPTLTTENLINGSRMSLWTYYDRTRLTDASALDKAVFIELRDGRAQSLLY
jgi:hypothetical protein